MLQIALCDDNEQHLADTAALIKRHAESAGTLIAVESFRSADALLLALTNREIEAEIAVLDIRMQGTDGITLAKKINVLAPCCQIIFLTGYLTYATEVYEAEHVYFVLKEKQEERLWPAVEAARSKYQSIVRNTIAFQTASGAEMRRFSDILYFERTGRKTLVCTAVGDLWIKESIGSIEKRALPAVFLKCHQSFIVNLEYVRSIGDEGYTLQNGMFIPISRANRKDAYERFLDCVNARVLRGSHFSR